MPRSVRGIVISKRKRYRSVGAPFAASLLSIALLAAAGCVDSRHIAASLASSSKPYQEFLEDPVALTTIKSIAIFPFDDRAPQPGFDADVFANKLANELAAHGKVRVLYPRDILDAVDRENREARRHNAQLREKMALGLYVPDRDAVDRDAVGIFADDSGEEPRPRRYRNPIKNVDEAVRLARRAKADAIIVGEVSDFDPYMRPRLSITMRLIATGNSETAARAIAELTQWGVPRAGASGAGGAIYIRQETFDSSVGSVGLEVSRHGRSRLISNHPFDTEVFVRSMTNYYDVVAGQLARAYVDARKDAIKEAEDRARAAARARNRDQDEAVARMKAMMERDSRIPDFETDSRGEAYFDQAFVDRNALLAANGGDRRIQSWRPDGRRLQAATPAQRMARDGMIPENERGAGLEGHPAMVDSSFPDADAMMELNLGNRDMGWRPDYFNRANPRKSAPLYDAEEFRGW